jgi:hypothetical protein
MSIFWLFIAFIGIVSTTRDLSGLVGEYESLSVKFYLHEFPQYNDCVSDKNTYISLIQKYKYSKHGGEFWWLEQLKISPWRVLNPNDASLFVIGLHPGFVSRHRACMIPFLDSMNMTFENEYFKSNHGRDHVMLGTGM